MFSALRQGSPIYILDKGENLSLKTGSVVSVSAPQPVFGQPMNYTVNVTAKVDGQNVDFLQLPSSLSIATNQPNGLVVAESKEAMATEVEAMVKTSQQVIDGMEYHKKVVEAGDDMLKRLNPAFAKAREQEEKLSSLENKMVGMEGSLADIKDMLSKYLKNNQSTVQ